MLAQNNIISNIAHVHDKQTPPNSHGCKTDNKYDATISVGAAKLMICP